MNQMDIRFSKLSSIGFQIIQMILAQLPNQYFTVKKA